MSPPRPTTILAGSTTALFSARMAESQSLFKRESVSARQSGDPRVRADRGPGAWTSVIGTHRLVQRMWRSRARPGGHRRGQWGGFGLRTRSGSSRSVHRRLLTLSATRSPGPATVPCCAPRHLEPRPPSRTARRSRRRSSRGGGGWGGTTPIRNQARDPPRRNRDGPVLLRRNRVYDIQTVGRSASSLSVPPHDRIAHGHWGARLSPDDARRHPPHFASSSPRRSASRAWTSPTQHDLLNEGANY